MVKKAAFVMGILFLILAFIGSGYVILHQGRVNAGYAVIPFLWAILCLGYYRKKE